MKRKFGWVCIAVAAAMIFGGCQHAVVEFGKGEYGGTSIPPSSTQPSDIYISTFTTTTEAPVSTTSTEATTSSTTASTTKLPTKATQKTASQKEQSELADITADNMTDEMKEAIAAVKICRHCGHKKIRGHHHRYTISKECPDCGTFIECLACHVCGEPHDECPACNEAGNNNTTDATP